MRLQKFFRQFCFLKNRNAQGVFLIRKGTCGIVNYFLCYTVSTVYVILASTTCTVSPISGYRYSIDRSQKMKKETLPVVYVIIETCRYVPTVLGSY